MNSRGVWVAGTFATLNIGGSLTTTVSVVVTGED